jgi:hypothetical protein
MIVTILVTLKAAAKLGLLHNKSTPESN